MAFLKHFIFILSFFAVRNLVASQNYQRSFDRRIFVCYLPIDQTRPFKFYGCTKLFMDKNMTLYYRCDKEPGFFIKQSTNILVREWDKGLNEKLARGSVPTFDELCRDPDMKKLGMATLIPLVRDHLLRSQPEPSVGSGRDLDK